jgi:cellulase/cellobiase CelA1
MEKPTGIGGTVTNRWRIQWTFSGNQRMTSAWGAQVSPHGGSVTLTNLAWNATIAPGNSIQIGFSGAFGGGVSDPGSLL